MCDGKCVSHLGEWWGYGRLNVAECFLAECLSYCGRLCARSIQHLHPIHIHPSGIVGLVTRTFGSLTMGYPFGHREDFMDIYVK